MSVQVFGNIITMNKEHRVDRSEGETHNEALNTSTAMGKGKNLNKLPTFPIQPVH